jgi:hypothetical protein
VPAELLALLEIALYVEPMRSAVLEKLRGSINHSHSIMKHIIGGMDATKEFIFKAFMCFRCTFKVFGVIFFRGQNFECIKISVKIHWYISTAEFLKSKSGVVVRGQP